jgi:hypothetical protein
MGMNLQQNPQRRAITAQHNFQNQRPQPSMLLNSNAKPFSSNWSTQQQQQWSTHQSQPPTMASWNNMTQPGQRRSMPNMNPFFAYMIYLLKHLWNADYFDIYQMVEITISSYIYSSID